MSTKILRVNGIPVPGSGEMKRGSGVAGRTPPPTRRCHKNPPRSGGKPGGELDEEKKMCEFIN